MKQKKLLLLIFSFVLLIASACGKEKKVEKNSIRDEFVKLIGTEIPRAEETEREAMNAYNGYFTGDKVDTEALLAELENYIIPKYEKFMSDIEAIAVDYKENETIKEMYYSSMDYQFQALKKVTESLKNRSADYQSDAADLMKQAETKYAEYKMAVENMALQNNVMLVRK